jgi:sugar phosphate isomerase/epimerase
MDRRKMLQAGAAVLAAGSFAGRARAADAVAQKLKIDAYSRHLGWLRSADDVAQACIEMAFDGLDLTVRPYPGHVDPAKVKTDLPPFVNTIRGHGLIVDTITTNIADADSPNAEAILDAASSLGIKHYWWGTYRYDLTKPIQPQIEALKPRVAKLAKLNEKYGMKAMYHNYSGPGIVGNMIFDLLEVLQNFDSRYVSFHYDTGHAVEAGANGTWALGLRAAGPYIGGVSFKDYVLKLDLPIDEGGPFTGEPAQLNRRGPRPPGAPGTPRAPGGAGGGEDAPSGVPAPSRAAPMPSQAANTAPGGGRREGRPRAPLGRGGGGQPNPWRSYAVPLGTGMVDLPQVAQILKDINFDGPVEIQAEYPNGGADAGQDKITLPRAMVLGAMKRDLLTLRAVLGPAGLI